MLTGWNWNIKSIKIRKKQKKIIKKNKEKAPSRSYPTVFEVENGISIRTGIRDFQ